MNEADSDLLTIADNFSFYTLPDARYAISFGEPPTSLVVSADQLGCLLSCDILLPLSEHAQRIYSGQSSGGIVLSQYRSLDEIRSILVDLCYSGVIFSPQKKLAYAIDRAAALPAKQGSGNIGILTCHRPDLLEQILQSVRDITTNSEREYRIRVLDDSRPETTEADNRRHCDLLLSEGDLPVEYYGLEEQARFITNLKESFADKHSEIEYLLTPRSEPRIRTTGRIMNHLLLHNAGNKFLRLDDDIGLQPMQVRDNAASSTLGYASGSRETWFPHSPEEGEALTKSVDIDPFEAHGELLGLTLKDCIKLGNGRRFGKLDLTGGHKEDIGPIRPDSPVVLTFNGVLGDPGTNENLWLFDLKGGSRARLTVDEQRFFRTLAQRQVLAAYPKYTLASTHWCMTTTITGFDGGRMLPPCIPEGRGSDGLFGAMTNFLYPAGLALHFPWVLAHNPVPSKRWDKLLLSEPAPMTLTTWLIRLALSESSKCRSSIPAVRLQDFANTLIDISESSTRNLKWKLMNDYREMMTVRIGLLRSAIEDFSNAPFFWQKKAKSIEKIYLHHVVTDHFDKIISGFNYAGAPDQQLSTLRSHLKAFGRGVKAWPDFWKYCQELESRDGRR